MNKLTVGSLFAGIGGFDLGLERTGGFEVRWQCEIDPYCLRVLAKHWPHVRRYADIRDIAEAEPVDLICGGFPCQDISAANPNGEGLDGERSGLWFQMLRVIRLVRPRIVFVENVSALLNRGMGRVLAGLAESGYDAEWDVIPASAVGAPHRRERVWIVAYAAGDLWRTSRDARPEASDWGGSLLAYASSVDAQRQQPRDSYSEEWCRPQQGPPGPRSDENGWWSVEPNVGRVAHGIPARVDRLKGLGNAVVPQVVEWIGNRILEHENRVLALQKEGPQ